MFNFSKYKSIDLAVPGVSNEPSIFDLIKDQISTNESSKDLDYTKLPKVKPSKDDNQIQFAPGLEDMLFGASGSDKEKDGWKKVKLVIDAINSGKINDWQVVEKNISSVKVSQNIDTLLGKLTTIDFTEKVKSLFFEVAVKGHSYEAIKWGIGIGGINASKDEIESFLVLARHAEFTVYVSHVIFRESSKHSEYKKYLIELLPLTYQWGVISLINYIVQDKELISQQNVQRDIVIYGMENCDGIPMEVGFTIANAVDFDFLFKAGLDNEQLKHALVTLMGTLMQERSPLGGLLDLENGEAIFKNYLEFLEKSSVDVMVLDGLKDAEDFLGDDEEVKWEDRTSYLEKVKDQFGKVFSIEIVKKGLYNEKTKWATFRLIEKLKIKELKNDLRSLYEQAPLDYKITYLQSILSDLGDVDDIKFIFERVLSSMDFSSRKKQPMSKVNLIGTEHNNSYNYSSIVKHLWKIPSEDTVKHLKQALADYDPMIRSAACEAVSRLSSEWIDQEIKGLIKERTNDQPEYVKNSAQEALTKITA